MIAARSRRAPRVYAALRHGPENALSSSLWYAVGRLHRGARRRAACASEALVPRPQHARYTRKRSPSAGACASRPSRTRRPSSTTCLSRAWAPALRRGPTPRTSPTARRTRRCASAKGARAPRCCLLRFSPPPTPTRHFPLVYVRGSAACVPELAPRAEREVRPNMTLREALDVQQLATRCRGPSCRVRI